MKPKKRYPKNVGKYFCSPCFLDRKSKLLHYQMLEAAKEKICGLIKIEKTEKVSSPDHAVISPDLEDHLNWLLFDF